MENQDTIQLLKECDSGAKMAVTAIEEVLEKVENPRLKQLLNESKGHHATLGNEIHALLLEYHSEEQDPTPMAKGMSWLKTNMKMGMDYGDDTAADLITDGCNMGVKSLYHYLNQYEAANEKSRNIGKRIIAIEEALRDDLQIYL